MRHVVRWIPRKVRIWIGYGILKPTIYVFLPALIAAYYQTTCMQESLKLKSSGLYNWASQYDTAILVCAFGLMAVVFAVENLYAQLRSVDKTGQDVLTAFVAAIDNVVGLKANRFADQAAKVTADNKMRPGEIFKTITEPKTQIVALLQATLNVFHELWPGVKFKASLIKVIDGKHFEEPFYKFLPEHKNTRMTPKQLEEDSYSAASKALKKKMVIVPDFRAELKKKDPCYITTEDRTSEDGSMLSYRIDHPKLRLPVYIISICADVKGCITNEHRVTFKWLMEEIEMRIVLEHSLMLLKDEVGG